MNDTKFTPGPWRVGHREETAIPCTPIGADTIVARAVARFESGTEEEDANAHLIAAAPELYEALNCINFDDGMIAETLGEDLQDKINAALAKARGE